MRQAQPSVLKVCFVTQWYAPEPVSVPVLTAMELLRQGCDVTVLTGIPNLPDGEVHKGYRPWRQYKELDGDIPVIRSPLYPNHSKSSLKRMLNYLSWSVSASLIGMSTLRNADVNVVHCTPATAAIPAYIARRLFRTPYVVIVQDLWPDTVTASGFVRSNALSRAVSAVLAVAVRALYGNAAGVVAISEGMRKVLVDRGIRNEWLEVLPNSVDESVYQPLVPDSTIRAEYGVSESEFLLVYAGNQGAAQDLSTLIHAISRIPTERSVKLLLVGWGIERDMLKDLAARVAPDRVIFVDRVPPSQVRRIQAGADLSVVSLKRDPLFRITVPSKLQSLLASGLPVLGVVEGDAAEIITEAGAGFVARPGNVDSVVDAIEGALSSNADDLRAMGTAGRHFYLESMSSGLRSRRLTEFVARVHLVAQSSRTAARGGRSKRKGRVNGGA